MAGGRKINEGTGPIMDTVFTTREGEQRDQQVVRVEAGETVVGARVTVGNVAPGTEIVPARSTPRAVIIQNHGIKDVDLGPSGVVAGAGFRLLGADGQTTPPIHTRSAIFGIVAAGTQEVSVLEIY